MRRLLLCAALVAALSAGAQAPDLSAMDVVEKAVPMGPVAVVDDLPVTRDEFLAAYRNQRDQLRGMAGAEKVTETMLAETAIGVMMGLVTEKILLIESEKRGITVTEAEVRDQYNKELADIQNLALESANETLSETEILSRAGKTREELMASIRDSLLIKKAREQVAGNPTIPESEMRKFYDDRADIFERPGGVHIKQIYVRPEGGEAASPQSRDAARKEAERALLRIQTGEKFETVAEDVSDSPDAKNGGDLGMIPMDQLPPFFQQAVSKLEPGELSKVVETPQGYHIVYYVAREDEGKVSFEQARSRIETLLKRVKIEDAVQDFAQEIWEETDRVNIFLELQRTLGVPEGANAAAS